MRLLGSAYVRVAARERDAPEARERRSKKALPSQPCNVVVLLSNATVLPLPTVKTVAQGLNLWRESKTVIYAAIVSKP